MRAFKHLVVHVLDCGFSLGDLEELSQLLVGLGVRVEVHLGVLLQLFVGFVLLLSPCEFAFGQLLIHFLKESRLSRLYLPLMRSHLPLELLLRLLPFRLLLLKDVEKAETLILIRFLPLLRFFGQPFFPQEFSLAKLWLPYLRMLV